MHSMPPSRAHRCCHSYSIPPLQCCCPTVFLCMQAALDALNCGDAAAVAATGTVFNCNFPSASLGPVRGVALSHQGTSCVFPEFREMSEADGPHLPGATVHAARQHGCFRQQHGLTLQQQQQRHHRHLEVLLHCWWDCALWADMLCVSHISILTIPITTSSPPHRDRATHAQPQNVSKLCRRKTRVRVSGLTQPCSGQWSCGMCCVLLCYVTPHLYESVFACVCPALSCRDESVGSDGAALAMGRASLTVHSLRSDVAPQIETNRLNSDKAAYRLAAFVVHAAANKAGLPALGLEQSGLTIGR